MVRGLPNDGKSGLWRLGMENGVVLFHPFAIRPQISFVGVLLALLDHFFLIRF